MESSFEMTNKNIQWQMSSEIDELDNLFENLTFWWHSKLSSDHSQLLPISWRRNNDNHKYGSSQEHREKVCLSQKGKILFFRFNL